MDAISASLAQRWIATGHAVCPMAPHPAGGRTTVQVPTGVSQVSLVSAG